MRARAVVEHVLADNPVCVQAHVDPLIGHIRPSTQSEDLRRMQAKGQRERWWLRRWSGFGRGECVERSRQLAAAVRDGWDDAAVRVVLLRIDAGADRAVLIGRDR